MTPLPMNSSICGIMRVYCGLRMQTGNKPTRRPASRTAIMCSFRFAARCFHHALSHSCVRKMQSELLRVSRSSHSFRIPVNAAALSIRSMDNMACSARHGVLDQACQPFLPPELWDYSEFQVVQKPAAVAIPEQEQPFVRADVLRPHKFPGIIGSQKVKL